VVTGASRGIGKAIAVRLSSDGYRVIVTGRDRDALAATSAELAGPNHWIALDLREPQAGEALIDFALQCFGRIDVLVNNAGATKRGEFTALSDTDWLDGYSLKLFAAVRLTRLAWPYLRASKGSVVNIAGVGGRTPGPEFALGGSVNAAMMAMTKSLAETGIADGVQVNCVNPGPVRTDRFTRRLSQGMDESRFVETERITRVGEPDEIAGLVSFIVSPAGALLQGALIDMDGGSVKSV
jgi:NAD(P)-dependent dehydrogenase (short-subunit alcohol dehydrogenase family)